MKYHRNPTLHLPVNRFSLKILWSGIFPNNWSYIPHLPGLIFRKSRFSFRPLQPHCGKPSSPVSPLSAGSHLSLLFSFLPGKIGRGSKPWLRSGECFSVPANQEQWETTCARAMGNRKLECHEEEPPLTSNPRLQERFPREARALDFSIKSLHFRNCSSSEPWRSVSSKLTNSPSR